LKLKYLLENVFFSNIFNYIFNKAGHRHIQADADGIDIPASFWIGYRYSGTRLSSEITGYVLDARKNKLRDSRTRDWNGLPT
jgi:hypothetical protein